jgi:hypothetical protein
VKSEKLKKALDDSKQPFFCLGKALDDSKQPFFCKSKARTIRGKIIFVKMRLKRIRGKVIFPQLFMSDVLPQQKVLFEKRKEYQPRINAENADFFDIFALSAKPAFIGG